MKQERNGGIGWGVFLALFVVPYLIFSYDDIYDRRIAYLFDPESDDVFLIEMAPSLNKYMKWDVFIPFKSLHFVEPDGVDYIGKLHNEIYEFRADMELLKNDREAWREKFDQEIEMLMSNLSKDVFPLEFLDIEYNTRPIQNANSHMSETLASILRSYDIEEEEVLVVDAVILKSKVSPNQETDETTIRIVRKALLFKGMAAHALSEQGL